MIHEKVKRDSVWLQMNKSSDKKLRTCTYSKLSGFGHTIYGIIILTYYLIKIVSSILWIICYVQTFFISKALNLHIFSAKFHDQFHLPPHKSNFRPSGNFEEKKIYINHCILNHSVLLLHSSKSKTNIMLKITNTFPAFIPCLLLMLLIANCKC